MKNWVCTLLLVSFVRLQFVCCCGTIEHGVASVPVECCADQSCSTPVASPCACKHNAADGEAASQRHCTQVERTKQTQPSVVGSIASKSECGCQLCRQGSHLPHLFVSQHLRIASQQEFGAWLVVKNAASFTDTTPEPRAAVLATTELVTLDGGVSILCRLGRLLI